MYTIHFEAMILFSALVTIICFRNIEAYQDMTPRCPDGLEYLNGLCYPKAVCPPDRYLHTDGMCYLKKPIPCPYAPLPDVFSPLCATTTTPVPPIITPPTTSAPLPPIVEPEPPTTTSIPITTTELYTTTTTPPKAIDEQVRCPDGLEYLNGLCYPKAVCPPDRYLHTDGMCYLKKPIPCPYAPLPDVFSPLCATTTTPVPPIITPPTTSAPLPPIVEPEPPTTTSIPITTTELYTTTTTPPKAIDEQVRCPYGSIFMNEQCHKIVCPQGEHHEGQCLSPVCPLGTVWRGKRCQPPGYITTILEINNVITNRKQFSVATEQINNIEYSTLRPYNPDTDSSYNKPKAPGYIVQKPTSATPATTTTRTTTTTTTTAVPDSSELVPFNGCCTVKSPRICKNYPPKWVCFNRSQKLCDPRVCTRPVIYLKTPRIEYISNPPMLIMPPNPPLEGCQAPDCKENDIVDCSGCPHNRRENCSASCYNYFCPNGTCDFMNSQDFCALYPNGFGCNVNDGCIGSWCQNKNNWY